MHDNFEIIIFTVSSLSSNQLAIVIVVIVAFSSSSHLLNSPIQTISSGTKIPSIASGIGRDQVTWSLEECIKVFAESVDALKADLKSRGENSKNTES